MWVGNDVIRPFDHQTEGNIVLAATGNGARMCACVWIKQIFAIWCLRGAFFSRSSYIGKFNVCALWNDGFVMAPLSHAFIESTFHFKNGIFGCEEHWK